MKVIFFIMIFPLIILKHWFPCVSESSVVLFPSIVNVNELLKLTVSVMLYVPGCMYIIELLYSGVVTVLNAWVYVHAVSGVSPSVSSDPLTAI